MIGTDGSEMKEGMNLHYREARGADVPEIPGDLSLKTCGGTASMKVKHVKKPTNPGLMGCDNIHRLPFTKGHFPKMAECAHFHYENVEFGSIQEDEVLSTF